MLIVGSDREGDLEKSGMEAQALGEQKSPIRLQSSALSWALLPLLLILGLKHTVSHGANWSSNSWV